MFYSFIYLYIEYIDIKHIIIVLYYLYFKTEIYKISLKILLIYVHDTYVFIQKSEFSKKKNNPPRVYYNMLQGRRHGGFNPLQPPLQHGNYTNVLLCMCYVFDNNI